MIPLMKDYLIWLKAAEKTSKWTFSGICFVELLFLRWIMIFALCSLWMFQLKWSFRPRLDSLLGYEDVGPHLVHWVDGSLQAVLHHGPLDIQHTGGVVGAAVIYHVLDPVVEVFHHQLLGGFQHGLWDGLGTHATRRQLWGGKNIFIIKMMTWMWSTLQD